MSEQRIVVGVTPIYPGPGTPSSGTFVHSLFLAMQQQGVEVRVVAPVSRTRLAARRLLGGDSAGWSPAPDDPVVHRPRYWSVSARVFRWGSLGDRATMWHFQRSAERTLAEVSVGASFLYGHFLTGGLAALTVGERFGIPVTVALGESNVSQYERILGHDRVRDVLMRFARIVTVSRATEAYCRTLEPGLDERLAYVPNAVDMNRFYPRDRQMARDRLGLPPDLPIIAFSGHFIERKGPLRVLEALRQLGDVRGVFLGQGPQIPSGPLVLHAGPVPHDSVAVWLAAANVFVLPSLAEGMSNAILEALACHVPVVVSDLPFNHEFLPPAATEFVNPADPLDIARGVRRVLHDPARRLEMCRAGHDVVARLSLANRARSILELSCGPVVGRDATGAFR